MITLRQAILLKLLALLPLIFISCDDEDEVPSPFNANFSTTQLGISNSSPTADASIVFSRPSSAAGSVNLTLSSNNLSYGPDQDFYNGPAGTGNQLVLNFNAGDESVTFQVLKGAGLNIQQDETITYTIEDDASGNFEVGSNSTLTVNFSENFVAPGGINVLDAGGPDFTQQSFFDLSKAKQTTVNKTSWDLGFYSSGSSHNVIINSPNYAMARSLEKNALNDVSADDTVGFAFEMTIPPPNFDPSYGSVAWIDTPDGNLATTAIGDVASNAEDNPVYVIKRADGKSWKKFRVLQNGEGYTLQYADISDTEINTVEIDKISDLNFVYFDFDNEVSSVEPDKGSWDLMYSTYTEVLNLGAPGIDIPYGFKDYITINRYNTQVAMVMIADYAYNDLSLEDASALTYSTQINAIGSDWREGGGPSTDPALLEDRFYVLKDSDENYYKFKFTRLTSSSGERGHPEFMFELLQ